MSFLARSLSVAALATVASASNGIGGPLSDAVSLLQNNKAVLIKRTAVTQDPQQQKAAELAAACIEPGSQLSRDSREEALPTIELLASSSRALLELGATTEEMSCIRFITASAVFNHPLALVANRTKGVTPLETCIETVHRFPEDAFVQQNFLPAITNLADPVGGDELVSEVVRLGGLDAIFAALHRFTADNEGDVLMMGWAALSDFTSTKAGAAMLANHGGELKGCGFAVEQMRTHPTPYFAETTLHLTLKYEVLMTVHNMLSQDVDGTYGRSCLDAGIVEQAVYTMRVEDGLRAPQDMGCNVLADMLLQGPTAVTILKEAGAMEVARHALKTFSGGDDTPFIAGRTMGQAYPVTYACTRLLTGLETAP